MELSAINSNPTHETSYASNEHISTEMNNNSNNVTTPCNDQSKLSTHFVFNGTMTQ